MIREITVFEETDSTNERAAQLGRSGVAPGIAIFAERQTAGRGRFGRRWESSGHRGLWFSLLLRPELPVEHWARLTTWAAVGVATAIEQSVGVKVEIKWPNDLQIRGGKIAGILTETIFDAGTKPFAVVGIGVNVNHELADFPPELVGKAGSLRIAAERTFDRSALAVEILRALDERFSALSSRFPSLVEEAAQRSVLLGEWIAVRAGASLVEGVATGLDREGQLLLRVGDGEIRTLTAGEVSLSAATRDT
jgi:BirA family biotin operon repressor/biotin-[acetyl-CoA-carboxylase] ligase